MEQQITLTLSPQRLEYIANVLSQRPYAEVAQVLAEIQQQLQAQAQAQASASGALANGQDGAAKASPH